MIDQDTLDYLFAALPMYHRVGAVAFKKDLTNTLALCALVDNPQHKFKSIHVGGTNGKGSTSHLLAAVFQAKGLKVGLYTSPHYKDFRERIKINGQYIPEQYVVDFVAAHKTNFEEIQPSFFEMTVALAFKYFADEQVDLAIIEVGLGGRLDSTNVLTPLLSVITNISLDHTNMLGNTLPEIAYEKAGIIKPGVPVVIGEYDETTAPVFKAKAEAVGAPIVFANQRYQIMQHLRFLGTNYEEGDGVKTGGKVPFEEPENKGKRTFWDFTYYDIYRHKTRIIERITVNLKGDYQAKNILTVIQTLETYNSLPDAIIVDEEDLREGFGRLKSMTKLLGRWHIVSQKPYTIADSAHNEAGVALVLKQVADFSYTRLHIVMGCVNDKDITNILKLYPTEATYYFAKANIPRGLPAETLREQGAALGLHGKGYATVKEALEAARAQAADTDLIMIMGSIFVVAEIL
jgi:dihydrofolate synthase / folylpolyglutamate synthase